MKYKILITLLLLLNIHNALGQQAETKTGATEFYFHSGISVPKSQYNFAEFYNTSLNMGIGIGFDLSPSYLFAVELTYNKFDLDKTAFINSHENLVGTASEGDKAIYSFTACTKAKLGTFFTKITPYLKLNFGFMHQRYDDLYVEVFNPDTSYVLPATFDTSITFHFGTGIDIKLIKGYFIFCEAKFDYAFTGENHTQYMPIKVGILYRK